MGLEICRIGNGRTAEEFKRISGVIIYHLPMLNEKIGSPLITATLFSNLDQSSFKQGS
jgi:hypothetical protein